MINREIILEIINAWIRLVSAKIEEAEEKSKELPADCLWPCAYVEAAFLSAIRCHEAARIFAPLLQRELGIPAIVRDGIVNLPMDFLEDHIHYVKNYPNRHRAGKPMRLNIDHSWVELGDGHIVSYHPYINIKNQTGVGYIKEFLMITDPEMSAGFYEKKIYEPIAVTEIKEGNPIIVFPDGQRLGLMLSPSQISYFSKLTSRTTTKETNHAR